MFVPLKKFGEAIKSFGSNEEKSIRFMIRNLPDLADKNIKQQYAALALFQEFTLEKGNHIVTEFQQESKYSYLIVAGEVLLQIAHNPIT